MDNTKSPENDKKMTQAATQQANKPQQSKAASSTGKGWRLLALLLLLGFILAGGAIAWFGYTLWLERTASAQTMAQHTQLIETLQKNIDDTSATQKDFTTKFEHKLKDLKTDQETLSKGRNFKRATVLLDEADFLIRLANQRILVEQQPKGAQALLESADEVLLTLNDPKLTAVRKILARNILTLQQAPTVDREGIFLRIDTLGESITRFRALPKHGLNPNMQQKQNPVIVVTDTSSLPLDSPTWYAQLWQNARDAAQRFFAKHFHTRSLEQPLIPLMSTTQEAQIRHRLHISLGNAQQALLRGESAIYKGSLAQVAKDTAQFFTKTKDTQAIIDQVVQLQAEAIQPALPDITASLYALRDYRESARNRLHGIER